MVYKIYSDPCLFELEKVYLVVMQVNIDVAFFPNQTSRETQCSFTNTYSSFNINCTDMRKPLSLNVTKKNVFYKKKKRMFKFKM